MKGTKLKNKTITQSPEPYIQSSSRDHSIPQEPNQINHIQIHKFFFFFFFERRVESLLNQTTIIQVRPTLQMVTDHKHSCIPYRSS